MYKVKEGCPGCGACQDVCPVNAISQGKDLAVVINGDCIDCGVCAGTCPIGLIEKVPQEPEVQSLKGGSKRNSSAKAEQVEGGLTDEETGTGL